MSGFIDPLIKFKQAYKIEPNGCWTWTRALDRDGYGHVMAYGKQLRAHRYSYSVFCGSIPEGKYVLHKCDNPACVNPEHLFIGNQADNMHDCISKERHGWCFGIGEQNGKAKLSEDAVQDILQHARAYDPQYSYSAFARRYGVNLSTIQDALFRRTWKHIDP